MTTLTLFTKPGCHLCEVAAEVVDTVAADFSEDDVAIESVDILSDPELTQRYGEKIPVLLIDDDLHAYWRIDSGRLRRALEQRVPSAS